MRHAAPAHGVTRAPPAQPPRSQRTARRNRDAVLLLLLLFLINGESIPMTRMGRGGTVAGTSLTAGPPPPPTPRDAAPDGAEGDTAVVPEPPAEDNEPSGYGHTLPPAVAEAAVPFAPLLDPLSTTRRRQRQRLLARPGGPVGPPDIPEDNMEDIPVDTGLAPQ